jgi:hypothetical protein
MLSKLPCPLIKEVFQFLDPQSSHRLVCSCKQMRDDSTEKMWFHKRSDIFIRFLIKNNGDLQKLPPRLDNVILSITRLDLSTCTSSYSPQNTDDCRKVSEPSTSGRFSFYK